MHEFYIRVETEFKRQGKTRNQFCKERNVPYSSLQKYWDTDRLPQGDVLEEIANFLNSSLDYLIFGKNHEINGTTESIVALIKNINDEQRIELRGIIRQYIIFNKSSNEQN